MLHFSVQSLSNLCAIRVAYLAWTRHDVTEGRSSKSVYKKLIDAVLEDVQGLLLPDLAKSLVLMQAKPAGMHLLYFVKFLLSKTQLKNSHRWLTRDMLFNFLVLNGDGLINQRKTAEKLINSGLLDNVDAFRLACVNFLETEILKLWPSVMPHIMKKILQDSQDTKHLGKNSCSPATICYNRCNADLATVLSQRIVRTRYSTEPSEVLFWIRCCMWMERNRKDASCYMDEIAGDHKLPLHDAIRSGNVACLEYFKLYIRLKYDDIEIIDYIFSHPYGDRRVQCFIYQFSSLSPQRKSFLFQKYPQKMISHFLQWPLSLTFAENMEEMWNLISEDLQEHFLQKIFVKSFPDYRNLYLPMSLEIIDFRCHETFTEIYMFEHLEDIWIAFWKMSSVSLRSLLLEKCVFSKLLSSSESQEFQENFEGSDVKEKLLRLFLESGELVFELFKRASIKESLRNLIARHMPENLENLEKTCIPFIGMISDDSVFIQSPLIPRNPGESSYMPRRSIDINFVDKIKEFLFSSSAVDKSYIRHRV